MEKQDRPSSRVCNSGLIWSVVKFCVAFFLAGHLGAVFSPVDFPLVAIWFPSGLYLGALLLAPRNQWPYFILAAYAANFGFDVTNNKPVWLSAIFTTGNSLEAVVAALLIGRFAAPPAVYSSPPRDDFDSAFLEKAEPEPEFQFSLKFFCTLVVAGFVAASLSATIGVLALKFFKSEPISSFFWIAWWAGDLMGILIVTPLLLSLASSERKASPLKSPLGFVEFFILNCCLIYLCSSILKSDSFVFHQATLLWPVLLWCAYRFDVLGVAIVNFVFVACIVQFKGLESHGVFFVIGSVGVKGLLRFQIFVSVVAFFSLAASAMFREYRLLTVDLRQSEGALRALVQDVRNREQRLQMALEATFSGVWDWNVVTGKAYFGERFYAMLGYEPGEFAASFESFSNLVIPEDLERAKLRVKAAMISNPQNYKQEFRCRTKNQKIKWIQARGRVVEWTADQKPARLTGVISDITEKKEQEQESFLLFTALEQAPINFFITDSEGNIEYVNSAFIEITGYSRPESLGCNPRFLKSDKQNKDFYKGMWDKILAGETWRGIIVNRRKDGRLYEEDKIIAPVLDSNGEITNYVSASRDVTHERLVENQLRQAQKMQALGTLAGGIAHDFNNILMAMHGYAELALEETEDEALVKRSLGQVILGTKRAGKLVEQILTFSRQRETHFQAFDLIPIFKETIKFLRASMPTNIQVRQEMEDECGTVLVDPAQIHQVILNLCSNAQYAMRERGGTLSIRAKRVSVVPTHYCISKNPLEAPEGFVCLEVEDTGSGIPPDVVEHVFEPFFTTKPQGDGTGMGLSTIQGIIYKGGGHITLKTEVGKGTNFSIYLPRLKTKTERTETPSALVGGTERILVVDDEEHLIDLLKSMLQKWGYQVTTCYNGQEALLRFEADHGAYDLVLTDQTMPGMTGSELARRLLKLKPDLSVVSMTGFSEQLSSEVVAEIGIARLINKPIIGARLAEAIRSAIDEKKRKNSA